MQRQEHLNFDHQRELFDPKDAKSIIVIGAGAVGGLVVDTLASEGFTDITVLDDDVLNSSNIPMSVYRPRDIFRLKVEALQEIVEINTGVVINARAEKYKGGPFKTPVICCVDDIDQRKIVWERVHRNPQVGLFIDTRIAEEYIEVFAIRPCDPEDVEYYKYFIRYSSADAHQQTCGSHGSKHISSTTANAACAALTYWCSGGIPNKHFRMLAGIFKQV